MFLAIYTCLTAVKQAVDFSRVIELSLTIAFISKQLKEEALDRTL